jgi:protein-S-isoprenylcysteine O-methyltransferase Ste14
MSGAETWQLNADGLIAPIIVFRACAVLGWLGLLAGFVGAPRTSGGQTPRRAWSSLGGLAIQAVALGLVWGWRRPDGAPFIAPAVDWCLVPVAVVLAAGADWLAFRAVRDLGRQWSIEARVLADHQLVTTGAYAIVRHPIYTAIYALMVVTGLAFSTWAAVVIAIVTYWVGTTLRAASEERLLRDRFGGAYAEYVATVPATFPRLGRRSPSRG